MIGAGHQRVSVHNGRRGFTGLIPGAIAAAAALDRHNLIGYRAGY
jgi:hypothetical protein